MDSQILYSSSSSSSSSFIVTTTILKMSTIAKIFTFLLCLLFYYNKNNAFEIIHSVRAAPDHQIKCVEKERQALLKFKQEVVDDYNRLSSWGSEEYQTDCCKWHGVYCNNRTGNVITLNLHGPYGVNNFTSTHEPLTSPDDVIYAIVPLKPTPLEPLMGQISTSLLELKYLEHLDLSYNQFKGNIPPFLGSFTRLTYLNLSFAGFYGKVPHQLGNLSSLKTFHLMASDLYTDNLQWLSSLQSLTTLYLESLTLSSDWAATVSSLSKLRVFSMRYCALPYLTPSSLNSINYSAPLDIMHLSSNDLNSSVYSWLFNFNNSVTKITLSGNNLHGSLPDGFANTVSLVHLDLSSNFLQGKMLEFVKNLSRRLSRTLEYLNLGWNLISGPLPDTIVEFQSLKELRLGWNKLNGSMPKAFGELPNLTVLDLSGNQIGGVLQESIGLLTALEKLSLYSNNLEGVISQSHLRNLSRLQMLDLSHNSGLALRLHSNWIPPFQLQILRLGNCKLGPHFPKWIQTQKNISEIDLSTTGISYEIPSWFWDQISGVKILDLSNNLMDNTLPNLHTKGSDLGRLDLSSNHFKGPIPRLPNTIEMVDLSKNGLSGEITFLCNSPFNNLAYLDLSDNQLSGELSGCWAHLGNLQFLNLNNNNLSGKIPSSMGSLPLIGAMLLRKNNFTKELPRSWQHSNLQFIDLGENRLSGAIPEWLGRNLSKLIVLDLSWNNISGSIPQNICYLSLVRILDLSGNKISGTIPKCISNLSAMIQEQNVMPKVGLRFVYFDPFDHFYIHVLSYEATLTWKGRETKYKSTLRFVKSIDLSSNRLTGDIPLEVTTLIGLVALNLSRNHLTGILPQEIGKLKSLDFLDLSRNEIFGEIPSSLSQVSLLGVLDLSYNNLIGRIPTGTQLQSFDASSYANNSGLCGEPLTRVCPEDELPQDPNLEGGAEEHEDKFITTGFYLSMALGFIVGFWGVCGSLFLNRSLRHAFLECINK